VRLLTKLVHTTGYTYGDGDRYELTRDAALAHAQTQAIAEARNHCHGSWDTCDFIRERADELMREWGYQDGC